jgi:hypothetical protein
MSDSDTDSEGPEPYVFVLGNVEVPDDIDNENTILQILHWIGFRTEALREAIVDDSFETFEDLKLLTEKDITSMASGFAGRTVQDGRINFGLRRTKLTKALIHWTQDFYRVSETPTIIGLNEITFKGQLDRALARAEIRKVLTSQTSTSAGAASPGPLESEKMWKQWEEKFINYTRSHIGANGIPLSYVIRENDDPNPNGEYPDFILKTIGCAPLDGEYYSADRLTVFNMIVSFTTGQPSGDWIKNTIRYADGRRSMNALRTHFAGEGNATRNMAEADRLHETLHYKSERSVSFEVFLTQCQKMYNIYEKEKEPMTDEAKVRFLFKKVQHPGLRGSIDALKAQQTAGTDLTYTMAANHLSTAVSELPEYISKNRTVSAANTGGDNEIGNGIYNADGSINTGYIPTWRSLSSADKAKVAEARKKLGTKRKGNKNGNSNTFNKSAQANTMKQLKSQNKIFKRQIKALKRVNADGDNESDDSDDVSTDAGDTFGGKASKKKKKTGKK